MSENFYGLPYDVLKSISDAHADMQLENEPVAVLKLCKNLGVIAQRDSELPEEVEGYIKRKAEDEYEIYYNPNYSSIRRQRFTIAHF